MGLEVGRGEGAEGGWVGLEGQGSCSKHVLCYASPPSTTKDFFKSTTSTLHEGSGAIVVGVLEKCKMYCDEFIHLVMPAGLSLLMLAF